MYGANFIYFLNIVTLLDTRHLCFILSYCIFVSRLVICCSKFFMSGIIIIFVIIIRLHRYCYRVAWSVTVCRSRSWALWKWLNRSRWCLGAETDWPKEPLLVGGADPQLEGAIFQGCLAHWESLLQCTQKNSWTDLGWLVGWQDWWCSLSSKFFDHLLLLGHIASSNSSLLLHME